MCPSSGTSTTKLRIFARLVLPILPFLSISGIRFTVFYSGKGSRGHAPGLAPCVPSGSG